MRFLKRHRDKNRAKKGFTLVEMMLALLIFVALTCIVAMGIPVAFQTYQKVVKASDAQMALSTTSSALQGELGSATAVLLDGTTVSAFQGEDGYWKKIANGEGEGDNGLSETFGYIDGSPAKFVAFGTDSPQPLVPAKSIAEGLKVSVGSITYDASNQCFTVTNLQVKDADGSTGTIGTVLASTGETGSFSINAPFCREASQ